MDSFHSVLLKGQSSIVQSSFQQDAKPSKHKTSADSLFPFTKSPVTILNSRSTDSHQVGHAVGYSVNVHALDFHRSKATASSVVA